MTFNPQNLLDVRALLHEHLGIPLNALGIQGDTDHAENGDSYHPGRNQLISGSYSVVESSRDRNGLTDAAAALDIGTFSKQVAGRTHNLRTMSAWLVEQAKAQTADTQAIREIIYSLDGDEVKRWDRLKIRDTGDDRHRTHTHVSYFRDTEHIDKKPLYLRYLIAIGLIEGDEMPDPLRKDNDFRALIERSAAFWTGDAVVENDVSGHPFRLAATAADIAALRKDMIAVKANLATLAGRDLVDEQEIAQAVLTGLGQRDPKTIAATLRTVLTPEQATEVAALLTTP